eukprot:TRINITY_DN20996_c0_g1_i1.p1 TRINITY_DN20996_c0_g1~~TRINITY_DN20996_c0_g1_i1.p1  ORF type:complete len:257 (+),score=116.32 TRINITY_DN20996_c0_g1_i1:127-897(+)
MEFHILKQKARGQLLDKYFVALNAAEEVREQEEKAIRFIQGRWERLRQQKRSRISKLAVLTMQRVFRGHLARLKVERMKIEAAKRDKQSLLDHFATAVQRIFRGFYVRKWVADHYKRKAYLAQVVEKSNEVRQMGQQHYEEQLARHEEEEKSRHVREFAKLSSKMLYVASTATIPGVMAQKPLHPSLHSTYGPSVEGALRLHRKKFKPNLPKKTSQDPLATLTQTADCEGEKNKPFVTTVKSDKTLLSKPLKTYSG